MNRLSILLAIIVAALSSLSGFGADFACESIFDGRYNSNPNVSITIIQAPGNNFRKITVTKDASVLNHIEKLVKKDKSRFDNIVEKISNGKYKLILNDGQTSIGFDRTSDSTGSLYISMPSTNRGKKRKSSSSYSFSGSDGNGVVYSYTSPGLESLDALDALEGLESLGAL